METRARLGALPRAAIVLVTLALLTLLVGIAIALAAKPATLPQPFGIALNGLVTFDSGGDIWVAGSDGSDPHPITSGPERDISPMFSPDGTRLAYWSRPEGDTAPAYDAGPASLVVADADGTHADVVATDLVVTPFQPPAWSPDGTRILFQMVQDGQDVIAVVDAGGGPPEALTSGQGPAWSPDGQRVVFNGGDLPDPGVYVIDAAGGVPKKVSQLKADDFGVPTWQPFGSRIAFFTPTDPNGDIWVVNDDGTGEQDISNDPAWEYWPSWSPDGTRIAYDRWDAELKGNRIVIADPDGGNVLVLDGPVVDGSQPVWSPDGRYVYAWPMNWGTGAMVLLDVTNKTPLRVISTPDSAGMSNWQRLAPWPSDNAPRGPAHHRNELTARMHLTGRLAQCMSGPAAVLVPTGHLVLRGSNVGTAACRGPEQTHDPGSFPGRSPDR